MRTSFVAGAIKRLLLVIGAFILCADSFAQLHLDWARTYRVDPSKTNQAWKILLASDGVVVGGTSVSAAGDADYVIIKYKANGDEAWVRRYNAGPGREDVLADMRADPNGNIFVTGSSDTVKYNAAGDFVWAQKQFWGRAVIANEKYVYVTGFSNLDFATAQLENDNVDGRANWVRTYNGVGNGPDYSEALALTANGELIVAGTEAYIWEAKFKYHTFTLFKYDSSGAEIWRTSTGFGQAGIPSIFGMRSLAVDLSGRTYYFGRIDASVNLAGALTPDGTTDKSAYARLYFPGQMKLTEEGDWVVTGCGYVAGGPDYVAKIEKYLPNGELIWERWFRAGGSGEAWAKAVALSTAGRIYAAGFTPQLSGDFDAFVVGYEADGTQTAVATYDGTSHLHDLANGIVVDSEGNVFVTGYSNAAEGGSEFLTLKYSMFPKIEAQSDGARHLEFLAPAGQPYAIEATTDFFDWQSLMTNTADGSGVAHFMDTNAVGMPKRFYRGKQP